MNVTEHAARYRPQSHLPTNCRTVILLAARTACRAVSFFPIFITNGDKSR